MIADRYSRPRQRSWLVPTIVVVGIAAFFLWESGWRPFEVIDVPTGSVAGNDATGADNKLTANGAEDPYELPDITPQQFEPDVDQLDPNDLLLNFDAHTTQADATDSNTDSKVTQVGYEPDSTGFDISDFSDAPPPPDMPAQTATATLPDMPSPRTPAPNRVSAELTAKLNKIDFLLDENDYLTAHRDLSTLYWYEPQNRDVFRGRIQHTAKSIYAAPQPHYMKPHVVQPGDTLGKIAAKYNVPWTYLARLNNVDPARIREGSKLKVIRGPFGAVVDLSDFELTVHAHGYYVQSYKIGIGAGQSTPLGEFKVANKLENPTYYPQGQPPVGKDDPSNPLGEYWLGIGDGYGIHGTIDPNSIGKAESKGCIRLNDGDIAEVFDLLTEGSTVMIRR